VRDHFFQRFSAAFRAISARRFLLSFAARAEGVALAGVIDRLIETLG